MHKAVEGRRLQHSRPYSSEMQHAEPSDAAARGGVEGHAGLDNKTHGQTSSRKVIQEMSERRAEESIEQS